MTTSTDRPIRMAALRVDRRASASFRHCDASGSMIDRTFAFEHYRLSNLRFSWSSEGPLLVFLESGVTFTMSIPPLIEWLRRLGNNVTAWADLRDGVVILTELRRFGVERDGSSSAVRALVAYYHGVLESHTPMLDDLPDDVAATTDEQLQLIIQLLLGAAVQSESRELYVRAIMELSDDAQTELMGRVESVIKDLVPWGQDLPDATAVNHISVDQRGVDDPASASSGASMRALQHQLSAAQAELEDVRCTNAALRVELSELRSSLAALRHPSTPADASQHGSLSRSPSQVLLG